MEDREILERVLAAIRRLNEQQVDGRILLLEEQVHDRLAARFSKTLLGIELRRVEGDQSFVLSSPKFGRYVMIDLS